MIALIFSYLLGSIPFGLVLTKLAKTDDIRKIGSGNVGATNVLRTGRKGLALATLLLDAGKGLLALFIAKALNADQLVMAACSVIVVLGHMFPIWLKFKGGKGVATTIAVIFYLNWVIGLIFAATWLTIFFSTKYSSLSAITALVVASVAAIFIEAMPFNLTIIIIAAIVILKHRENIIRLWQKKELRFGSK